MADTDDVKTDIVPESLAASADPETSSSTADMKKSIFARLPKDQRARTTDVTNTQGVEFEQLGLHHDLLKGIYEMGWDKPSPVQELAIPASLGGHDILARAKNGTGKTGSYLIPALNKIDLSVTTPCHPQVLVVVPARELALQTGNICICLGKYLKSSESGEKLKVLVSTGGTGFQGDVVRLQQAPHVVIATPGRLMDLSDAGMIKYDLCKTFVLDEVSETILKGEDHLIFTIFQTNFFVTRSLFHVSRAYTNTGRQAAESGHGADDASSVDRISAQGASG